MSGALVPAPVVVHFKFGGESAHSAVTVPFPATPKAVCASILAARGDVRAMLADAYVGFELAVCDPNGGRPMAGDAAAIASETKVEVVLTKEYAVRAFAPVRKYVVGRFLGAKPPKFKTGRAAAVEWAMRSAPPELPGGHGALFLNQGGKVGRENLKGLRENGALGNFYLLMMQANTTDVCAIPMEGWYNFRPDAQRKVMTLEEAEEALERRAHNQTATTNFMERMKRNDGDLGNGTHDDDAGLSDDDDDDDANKNNQSDDDEDDDDPVEAARRRRQKEKRAAAKREKQQDTASKFGDAVDESAPGARGMRKQDGDDWEHDGGASDDEGAGEADELALDEPPPPPPAGGFADSDDDNDRDGEGGELDASGKALSKLIGKQEDTLDGGISDDSDDDDEFVDPDQEELHPFLLQQRDKQKAAQSAAAAAAAVTTAPAVMKPLQPEGGVKRSRSEDDVVGTSPVGRSAKTAKQTAKPDNATGSPNTARPIELALREILKKGGKPTTKDVTKQLRKRGLLNSDADKQELKETIGRVARIRKEGNASVVVLQ